MLQFPFLRELAETENKEETTNVSEYTAMD